MACWIPYWDLRCEKCSEGQKRLYGCDENSEIEDYWKVREWTWQRCPVKLITEQTSAYLNAYGFLQKGILPYQQGFKRNSNKYVEAMLLLETEFRKLQMDSMKQGKK